MKKSKVNLLLVIIWLIVIFIMSSFNANKSSGQSNLIVNIIIKIFSINNIMVVSILVRKIAHFCEYFILGVLCANLCRKKSDMFYAFMFCIIYAISDEIHQIFVPGRTFQIKDIIIDLMGVFLAICFIKRKFDKKQ